MHSRAPMNLGGGCRKTVVCWSGVTTPGGNTMPFYCSVLVC